MRRPSKRFCKFGFLTTTEPYDPEIHNCGATVEERAFNYFNVEEIFLMEEEVRILAATQRSRLKLLAKFAKTCLRTKTSRRRRESRVTTNSSLVRQTWVRTMRFSTKGLF